MLYYLNFKGILITRWLVPRQAIYLFSWQKHQEMVRDSQRLRALGTGPRMSVADFKSMLNHSTLGELKQAT
jgi:hypothetical protein